MIVVLPLPTSARSQLEHKLTKDGRTCLEIRNLVIFFCQLPLELLDGHQHNQHIDYILTYLNLLFLLLLRQLA